MRRLIRWVKAQTAHDVYAAMGIGGAVCFVLAALTYELQWYLTATAFAGLTAFFYVAFGLLFVRIFIPLTGPDDA